MTTVRRWVVLGPPAGADPAGPPRLEIDCWRSCPWWASWSVGWDHEAHPREWRLMLRLGPFGLSVERVQ